MAVDLAGLDWVIIALIVLGTVLAAILCYAPFILSGDITRDEERREGDRFYEE
jgi:hypothetical protein